MNHMVDKVLLSLSIWYLSVSDKVFYIKVARLTIFSNGISH